MEVDNSENQDDMEDYIDSNNQPSRRKRGLGLCKLCGQFGHYQKTCPTVGSYPFNLPGQQDRNHQQEDSNEIDENSGFDGMDKLKKIKHSKFHFNSTSESNISLIPPDPTSFKGDDYSTDDDETPQDHNTLTGETGVQGHGESVSNSHDQYNQVSNELTGLNSSDFLNFDDKNNASGNSRRWGTWKKDMRRFVGTHFPLRIKDEKTPDGKVKDRRHRCKYSNCKRKSKFKCLTCEVFLCIGSTETDNCFLLFHTFAPSNSGIPNSNYVNDVIDNKNT